jgi:nitrogen PTS system EIIA component
MNLITQYLHADHIVLDAPYTSKKRSFEAVSQLFATLDTQTASSVYDALSSRERMASTGLGHGVAIPHGRVAGLKQTLCAVIRLAAPLEFDSPDGLPVRLMVVLLVPEHAGQSHLDCLGELTTMLSSTSFRQTVLTAPTASEVYRAFITHQLDAQSLNYAENGVDYGVDYGVD